MDNQIICFKFNKVPYKFKTSYVKKITANIMPIFKNYSSGEEVLNKYFND